MRTQTAREKAEAHVALIRREYPKPLRAIDGCGQLDGWYCVAVAAACYERLPYASSDVFGDYFIKIARLNDAGRFEEAWLALTDYYEERFS